MAADLGVNANQPPLDLGPLNIGTVPAAQVMESGEPLGTQGVNDTFATAQFLDLGTRQSNDPIMDVQGTMSFVDQFPASPATLADRDFYEVSLRQGDILDIATIGAVSAVDVFYDDGSRWFTVDSALTLSNNQNIFLPAESPLQIEGDITIARVVPETGSYFIRLAAARTGAYTMGLRTFRPVTESLPVGETQKIFLDFDGPPISATEFANFPGVDPSTLRIPTFVETLANLRPDVFYDPQTDSFNTAAIDAVIDNIVSGVRGHFERIGDVGNNGDFFETGVPGQYAVEIVDSRSNPEARFDSNSLRVIVGGNETTFGSDPTDDTILLGLSQTIDVGNFDLNETVYVIAEEPLLLIEAAVEDDLLGIAPTSSVFDAYANAVAVTISHEVGHAIGMRHTAVNFRPSITDVTATIAADSGAGFDNIVGTADDTILQFRNDAFNNEGIVGTQRIVELIANTLVSGTTGTAVGGGAGGSGSDTGLAFVDVNGNGVFDAASEAGLSGVTVFLDRDGDGVLDADEPRSTTDADGRYNLSVSQADLTASIVAVAPEGISSTTGLRQNITDGVAPNFGFRAPAGADFFGRVYTDGDGDATIDPNESFAEGIYVYADLDGDNEPDLGEPGDYTDGDGRYRLPLANPGTYTFRIVTPPGFDISFPPGGEHVATYNGITVDGQYDFGLLPSQDFGDAPNSYQTLSGNNGAAHQVVSGLRLGTLIDRDVDGQPSVNADGDGADEDGVRFLSPISPGAPAVMEIDVLNSTGSAAFLTGFIDLNNDGDFGDDGERFVDRVVGSDVATQTLTVNVDIPSGATVGGSYARFRLSPSGGVGPGGFVAGGEVEDYRVEVRQTADLAEDDAFNVPRNSIANRLDVLANDFRLTADSLNITSIDTFATEGEVRIVDGGDAVTYTPPTGFTGTDRFTYTVTDSLTGRTAQAEVVVTVQFQTAVPIAVDDIFVVPENSTDRPLNVLANDVVSLAGGLSIVAVQSGSAGGAVTIVGGGQSLRYTPQPGFSGTEQFTYTIQDSAGSISTAQITIVTSPNAAADDIVDYSLRLLDVNNANRELQTIGAGQEFFLEVSVDDLRGLGVDVEGVASGFIDLLYTDDLVEVVRRDVAPGDPNPLPFDIEFGRFFGLDQSGTFRTGDITTPGLIDEVGGVQSISSDTPTGLENFTGSEVLFRIRLRATGVGVAEFLADPADAVQSETILVDGAQVVAVPQQRFGRAQLTILPGGVTLGTAVDDSFGSGIDSDGNAIIAGRGAVLDVLDNDLIAQAGGLVEFEIARDASQGTVRINDNGTDDPADDTIVYTRGANASGIESFTYTIQTADGSFSTANVTIDLGGDKLVGYEFQLVDAAGNPTSSINAGDRFGIQVFANDLRVDGTHVFGAYLDISYTASNITPAPPTADTPPQFDFGVEFDDRFDEPSADGFSGVPGIIDEFGSFSEDGLTEDEILVNGELDTRLPVATLFFDATSAGPVRIAGGPVESFPQRDTLLFGRDEPVPVEAIRYDTLTFTVGGSSSSSTLQNSVSAPDVNDDGFVTPIDALLVLNQMQRDRFSGGGEDAGTSGSDGGGRYYPDVNGDGEITAIDALSVLNHIRRSRGSAGGESVEGVATNDASGVGVIDIDRSTEVVLTRIGSVQDAAVAQWTGEADLANDFDAAPVSGSVVSQPSASRGSVVAEDDDDDGLLTLLAAGRLA